MHTVTSPDPAQDHRRAKVWRTLLPLAVALVVFLGGLGRRDVVSSHEARVAQTARVMAASGWPWSAMPVDAAAIAVREDPDGAYAVPRFDLPPMRVNPWLVPVLNGQARLQKPPLPNWCAAVLYRVFGVSEFVTRLTPALLAAVATLLVADLARILVGRTASTVAALLWASTLVVASECREATADPYLMFFTLAAVWAWVRASERDGAGGLLVAAFYASLGLGVLAKGPFIFVHVCIALLAYRLCCRRRPRAGWLAHATGLLIVLAIAAPWPLYVVTHVDHVVALWRMETTRGGGADAGEILRLSWRYLPRLVEMSLPWTPLWIAGLATTIRGGFASSSPRSRRRWLPLLWGVATVVVFSLSSEKKTAYLLPMMPAMVLVAATGAIAARRASAVLIVAQGVLGIAGVVAGFVMLGGRPTQIEVVAAVIIGAAAVALLLLGTHRGRVARPGTRTIRRWFVPKAVGCALGCLLVVALAHPAKENARSAKPFAAAAGPLLRPPADVYVPGLPAEAAFYLPLDLHYDPSLRELFHLVEPPRGRALSESDLRPKLAHGRVVAAEVVDLPGASADAHWRLVRVTVEPETRANAP